VIGDAPRRHAGPSFSAPRRVPHIQPLPLLNHASSCWQGTFASYLHCPYSVPCALLIRVPFLVGVLFCLSGPPHHLTPYFAAVSVVDRGCQSQSPRLLLQDPAAHLQYNSRHGTGRIYAFPAFIDLHTRAPAVSTSRLGVTRPLSDTVTAPPGPPRLLSVVRYAILPGTTARG
jgi:hypothetical protein